MSRREPKRRKVTWPRECKVREVNVMRTLPPGCQILSITYRDGTPRACKFYQAILPQGCTFNQHWTYTKHATVKARHAQINIEAARQCLNWLLAAKASGCLEPVDKKDHGLLELLEWKRMPQALPPVPIWRVASKKWQSGRLRPRSDLSCPIEI